VWFDTEIAKAAPLSPLGVETNHERTLYVRYVFRNHLISGERDWFAELTGWVPAVAILSR
jgi:hypothetical protein